MRLITTQCPNRRRGLARPVAFVLVTSLVSEPVMAQAQSAAASVSSISTPTVELDAPAPPLGPLPPCVALASSAPGATEAPHVEEAKMPSDASREVDLGKALLRVPDNQAALVRFQRAFDRSGHADALEWIVVTLQKLHRYKEARANIEILLAMTGTVLTLDRRKEACGTAASLAQFIGALRVIATEPGAAVTINEKAIGKTPLPDVERVDGEREAEVRVTKDGFKPFVWKGIVHGGREVTVRATLEKDVHEGELLVEAGKTEQIRVDGISMGLAKWDGPLASGPHALLVTAPLKTPFSMDLTIETSKPRAVSVSLVERVPVWVWVLGGSLVAGGAALGTAFLFKQSPAQGTLQPLYVDLSGAYK